MSLRSQSVVFVKILAAFSCGIFIPHHFVFTKLYLLIITSIFLLHLILFLISCLWKSIKVYSHKKIIAFFIYLVIFLLGSLRLLTDPDYPDADHFSKKTSQYLKVYVADEPKKISGYLRFKARVIATGRVMKMTRSAGLLMVSIRPKDSAFPAITYGNIYLVPARFSEVPSVRNPAEFDSKTMMANQHIYHWTFLEDRELIMIPGQAGSSVFRFAMAMRDQQVQIFRTLIKSDEAFAVAATLILGYRTELDEQTMAVYSKTGTIHALSVSGMHVAMIYLVLEFALRWMNQRTLLKWTKVILMLSLIWFYTLVTGCSASVLRSAIMLSMFVLKESLHKDAGGYHILALSAFLLLFFNTNLLWDTGFQLSYLAVFGLIYLQPKIQAIFDFQYWILQQVWNILSVSLAAQLFTWPLSIYYFHQFPVYFLLSNLFITIPLTILMYSGLSILIFHLYWLAAPFEWLLHLMNTGLARIAALPYPAVTQIWISKTQMILLFLAIIITFEGICRKRKLMLLAGLILLVLFQAMLLSDKVAARQQLMIILYSLNKNYAAAFIQGNHAVLLTDLSKRDKMFRFHVLPSLDERKISNIRFLRWDQVRNHQLRFGKFRILLLDSFFNHRAIQQQPQFDAVWIHGNPRVNIDRLRSTVHFKQIWIDASNPRSLTKKIAHDTLNFKKSILVFKQIKASLIKLN